MKTLTEAEAAGRRKKLTVLTLAVVAAALFGSGWGMFTFLNDLPTLHGRNHIIIPMFLVFELSAIACAYGGRINRLQYGHMGIQGWLVWVFATASGLMSASDGTGWESFYRFLLPMVAATMFELLIRGERRDLTQRETPLERIRRRALAAWGLLDDVDQDDETAARSRMAAKLATLAYRAHQVAGSKKAPRAVRRYHRVLRRATVRMGFATDADMIAEVRLHLDALYQSMSATGPESVAGLNIWQATGPRVEPGWQLVGREPGGSLFGAPAAPRTEAPRPARISPVRRPQRLGRLAGHTRPGKRPQAPATPAPAPILSPATAALAAPPQTTTKTITTTTTTRTTNGKRKARHKGDNKANQQAEAFRRWQADPEVSTRDLAARTGVPQSTMARWVKTWKESVPA